MRKCFNISLLAAVMCLLAVSCGKDPMFEKGDYFCEDDHLVFFENGNNILFQWTVASLPDEQKEVILNILNNMVKVEGGTFMMGAQKTDSTAANYDSQARNDENPVHKVTLSDFYLCRYEVTQKEWTVIMGDNKQFDPKMGQGDDYPVYNISWSEAKTFIERLNYFTGLEFALPTEAQWEYAARGGNRSKSTTYSGDNDADYVAWHSLNSNYSSHKVGLLQPNELGLYDMSGNVWEWCRDGYGEYRAQEEMDPEAAAMNNKVLRGGSWCYMPDRCRVTQRENYNKDASTASYGFRLSLKYTER